MALAKVLPIQPGSIFRTDDGIDFDVFTEEMAQHSGFVYDFKPEFVRSIHHGAIFTGFFTSHGTGGYRFHQSWLDFDFTIDYPGVSNG